MQLFLAFLSSAHEPQSTFWWQVGLRREDSWEHLTQQSLQCTGGHLQHTAAWHCAATWGVLVFCHAVLLSIMPCRKAYPASDAEDLGNKINQIVFSKHWLLLGPREISKCIEGNRNGVEWAQRMSLTFPLFSEQGSLLQSLPHSLSPLTLPWSCDGFHSFSWAARKLRAIHVSASAVETPSVFKEDPSDCLLLTLYRWEPLLCITPAVLLKLLWYSINYSFLNNTGLNPYCDAQNYLQAFWNPLLQLQSRIIGRSTPCQKYIRTELFAEETQRGMEKCCSRTAQLRSSKYYPISFFLILFLM